ncbi:hypothetical protein [Oceanicoccus sp. KOV_DT_Chl]|uniref:hypothetical protein n=1 Tax=Oceanicoccus sp. KOV_DT_Chl TaxID=1904639 RepID=UPI000C7C3489|nr:hypothetical protein [Oceanicoccus sp. KOV_DT_Chl]
MKERAVRIGKPVPLVGVISEPDQIQPERPAVVIFNSGVMHHIGSCRLSVKMARSFAAAGHLVIRFDFSGIGDSEPRRGTDSFEVSAPKEAAEIMDYLQRKRGCKSFVLFGLCSGADAAYQTALIDDRVVAFAQIDPYCYRTFRYHVQYYASRFLVAERWKSSFKRLLAALRGEKKKQSAAEHSGIEDEYFEVPNYSRVFPPKEEVAEGLRKIIGRGVPNYVMFTGDEPDYNYKSQYLDSFKNIDFKNLLQLDYLVESNHIITDPRHQKFAVEQISAWLANVSTRLVNK